MDAQSPSGLRVHEEFFRRHQDTGIGPAPEGIETLGIVSGSLPRRANALVLEWAAAHREELRAAWKSANTGVNPGKIDPLE